MRLLFRQWRTWFQETPLLRVFVVNAVMTLVFVEHLSIQQADGRHEYEIIVDASPYKKDAVANRLKDLKLLPADNKGEDPDEDCTYTVQYHSGCSIHSFGDGKTREVEEGDADYHTK